MKDDLKAKMESLLGQQIEKVQMEWEVCLQRYPSGNGMNLASHIREWDNQPDCWKLDQKAFHETRDARKAWINLEPANRNNLQRGLELKNQHVKVSRNLGYCGSKSEHLDVKTNLSGDCLFIIFLLSVHPIDLHFLSSNNRNAYWKSQGSWLQHCILYEWWGKGAERSTSGSLSR